MALKDDILIAVLDNAVKYDGKASSGAVIGKLLGTHPEFRQHTANLMEEINRIVNEVNKYSLAEQKSRLLELAPEKLEKKEKKERQLPELPNAVMGKVVLRLAPYPSGPLHIGNAKPYILNDAYAKKYKGKLLLVIDDTIGTEEKAIAPEAYDLIPAGLKWLEVDFDDKIIYKSDRLPIYYEHALKLIEQGNAYVCFCSQEKLRYNRAHSIACACREKSSANHLKEWNKMLEGEYKSGDATLRLKTDLEHPNPAFRDRVLFRISEREHPKVGLKYKVWPMLEFSWAIDDYLLGTTHVIRGKELMMESEMELFIWNLFGWKPPVLIHTGLLNIEGVKISKSKSQQEIKSGMFTGWDDPRTWSLQSLRRRGILPKAIRDFCLSFGLNQNEITVPLDNLYSENRKLLEKKADRHFFISNPVEVTIEGATGREIKIKLHPDYPERGFRTFKTGNKFYISRSDVDEFHDGDMIRLMDCLNFIVDGAKLNYHSDEYAHYKAHGKRIIHWLPQEETLAKVELLMPDGSLQIGLAESEIKKLKPDAIIQFERIGFARLDHFEKDKAIFWFAHK
jgi:glutamyl-tRNA synthetase